MPCVLNDRSHQISSLEYMAGSLLVMKCDLLMLLF